MTQLSDPSLRARPRSRLLPAPLRCRKPSFTLGPTQPKSSESNLFSGPALPIALAFRLCPFMFIIQVHSPRRDSKSVHLAASSESLLPSRCCSHFSTSSLFLHLHLSHPKSHTPPLPLSISSPQQRKTQHLNPLLSRLFVVQPLLLFSAARKDHPPSPLSW